jgi:hypothetical protein
MDKKKAIDTILSIITLEAKKIKKKKGVVAIAPLRRPMGSIFAMDAAVSEVISEGAAIKPIPKQFDNLKWKLNDYQKAFLGEFVDYPYESLREEDYTYASKITGIPLTNIKSIRNTYGRKQEDVKVEDLKKYHDATVGETLRQANAVFTDANKMPEKSVNGKQWMSNPDPHFRGKSFGELSFNAGGKITREHERELPEYLYEWAMYFIEGSGNFKIKESSVVENSRFGRKDKTIIVTMTSEEKITDGFLDFASGRKLKETIKLEEVLKEFNDGFGTNFLIENQFTNKDGNLVCVIENNQITDGRRVKETKLIDMTFTDQARLAYALTQAAPPGNIPM